MDQLMTKEESYAERRRLFKDIWDTSMNMEDKEDIMTKPKVIKTLRLGEVDRCIAKKKKKQKLKNLRSVCNKLLDFCDRQDADDLFYEKMAAKKKSSTCSNPNVESKTKTKKSLKAKRKLRKTKSLFVPNIDEMLARGTAPERKESKISRDTSPIKVKQTSFAIDHIINNTVVKKKRDKKMLTGIKYNDL